MSDADRRFLDRLGDEARPLLGPAVTLSEASVDRSAGRTRLTLTLDTPVGERRVEASGDSLVAAAAELLRRLPEERLAVAFRQLVDDRSRVAPGR